MVASYEQVEPHIGIVRAPLAANLTLDVDGNFGPKAVSLDANGRVVVGTAGQSGFAGILIKKVPMIPAGRFTAAQTVNNWLGARAGDVVDIMLQGQITDVTGLAAGSKIYATAAGDLTTTATSNTYIGYTVEATRLIVVGAGIAG